MSKKPKLTQKEQLEIYVSDIRREIKRWCELKEGEHTDPFYNDGCNMSLVRNHIIWYKEKIVELLQDNFMLYPIEFFIPVPPEVPYDYNRHSVKTNIKDYPSTYERDKPILDQWGSYNYAIMNREKVFGDENEN